MEGVLEMITAVVLTALTRVVSTVAMVVPKTSVCLFVYGLPTKIVLFAIYLKLARAAWNKKTMQFYKELLTNKPPADLRRILPHKRHILT